jgi:hypothetical protein
MNRILNLNTNIVVIAFFSFAGLLGSAVMAQAKSAQHVVSTTTTAGASIMPELVLTPPTDAVGPVKEQSAKKIAVKNPTNKVVDTTDHIMPIGGTIWSLFRPVWNRSATTNSHELAH